MQKYIPHKMDLFVGPHQHKRNKPRFYTQNTIYLTYSAIEYFFSHHNVSRIQFRRSGYYFIDIFSKETWMVVSMNEVSSSGGSDGGSTSFRKALQERSFGALPTFK